jgi:hypothetical protein
MEGRIRGILVLDLARDVRFVCGLCTKFTAVSLSNIPAQSVQEGEAEAEWDLCGDLDVSEADF